MESTGDMDMKTKLIEIVKRDVKQIMELVVTCKTISKESVCVKKFCISVESCVHFGLRRKILGLLKTKSSSFALLHKIAKHCPDAAFIITKMTGLCYKFEQTSSSSTEDASIKHKSYLWVEIALFEKRLISILEYLISNASKYYENGAIITDSESSAILVSLLVGPTSIDYEPSSPYPSRTYNLIQRNSLSFSLSRKPRTIPKTKDKIEYISCLHQNVNSDLIYGKNNILISNPVNSDQLVAGYLSLHKIHHQDRDELILKWTANQLIFSISDSLDNDIERARSTNTIEISIDDILYIHCHQNEICDSPELIYSLECNLIFIGKDGVQKPPINFSQSRNMVTFLTCLETGLLPNGRLDPPICNTAKSRGIKSGYCVFKIIDNSILNEEIRTKSDNEIMKKFMKNNISGSTTSSSSTSVDNPQIKVGQFCSSIRHNILKRAFYGWLTYCRHLATIRMHLAQLIYEKTYLKVPKINQQVNKMLWSKYMEKNETKESIYNLTYANGIESEIRYELWPYLLGVYDWDINEIDRQQVFHKNQIHYEKKLSEWSTAEVIIQQKPRDEFNDSRSSDNLSPASSVENLFTNETLGDFCLNLQHIDKDVHRCDRNHPYFSDSKNLTKLRNVITTFIWENLDVGYMQGFVDIVAPLLVIFDEETITYACFTQLMKRLIKNFPSMSTDMDLNLINLKSLVQMFDNELYVLLMEKSCRNSDLDYGMRFFFSYRWFLLDFKREFAYTDLFLVWETIWAAEYLVTANFQLFIAFALLELYRGIFLSNKMDFTDVLKFFNDMAEHHDVHSVLHLARDLVSQLQDVINKD